jgi:hypothetical protein
MTAGNLIAGRFGHRQSWKLLGALMGLMLFFAMF